MVRNIHRSHHFSASARPAARKASTSATSLWFSRWLGDCESSTTRISPRKSLGPSPKTDIWKLRNLQRGFGRSFETAHWLTGLARKLKTLRLQTRAQWFSAGNHRFSMDLPWFSIKMSSSFHHFLIKKYGGGPVSISPICQDPVATASSAVSRKAGTEPALPMLCHLRRVFGRHKNVNGILRTPW